MNNIRGLSIAAVAVVALILLGTQFYVSVPAGHASVATLFGDVRPEPYEQGLHIPVNPLYDWHRYDVRQKSHKETANVPSQDQLQTSVEVSVQYRLVQADAPRILQETDMAASTSRPAVLGA